MVIMPGDDVILIGVGLFGDAIVNNQTGVVLLDGPHMGLDQEPEVRAGEFVLGEEALDAVVTDRALQQGGEAGAGGGAEGTNQVVAVEVEQFLVFHAASLPYLRSA